MSSEEPAPSPRVAREWLRRVEAEYGSAAITQELVLWLIRLGAPPDLLTDGLRIVEDELAHASLSHAVATAAGSEERPALVQERLGLPRRADRPLLVDAALHGVEVFCLGETVAVPLFVTMRQACTVPVAREALDRIVRDEVRHRDFGWALLDWLLEAGGEPMRERLQGALPGMLQRVRRSYGPSELDGRHDEPDEQDGRWGLMPSARYAEVLERCIERDYAPRFERVGLRISGLGGVE
ncbi:MAG: ferritin-like domain-containing protein [Myxococcales bacterium]|nr:ferritin-like domain-containing protein [Myxococcales bacterium]MCB9716118.1 ferritin-like domain-containing protein [Myxococcales bacterium]